MKLSYVFALKRKILFPEYNLIFYYVRYKVLKDGTGKRRGYAEQ